MSDKSLNRVAIIGGTHGAELTGAYLVKKFERFPHLVKRSSFETVTLLANPRAFKAGTRYIHKDLNRSFSLEDLNNTNLSTYEDLRAKEIYGLLVNNEKSKVDFIIDLHSTTANMGLTVILGKLWKEPLILNLAAYLTDVNSLVKLFNWSNTQNNSFLRSICPRNIAIEVGSIAHGTLNPWYFEKTEKLILTILDFLELYNQKPVKPTTSQITVFKGKDILDYPRNPNGELEAMIHPNLIAKDYKALNPGDPLFQSFQLSENQTITYQGSSTVFPTFIGEASYQEKGMAMCLADKQEVDLRENL
ncbi:MAG: aspartoacylase [Cyanophyceae cyanobacterium]